MSNCERVQCGRAVTEGDELFYKVRGKGEPLLLIAPGGGDGDQYLQIADILSDEYKVITYDRRANARSTMNHPHEFEIAQQSRDAVAVLHAAGEKSAYVFGNSSGAVIALDIAKTQPQAVRAVIAHEAPLPCVLCDSERWKRFFESCYLISLHFGSSIGAAKFFFGIKMPAVKLIKATMKAAAYAKEEQSMEDGKRISSKLACDILIKNELLPVTGYNPDFETMKKNNVKIVIAAGKWGLHKKTWYSEVSSILASRLNVKLAEFPGHHGSFMDNPAEWSAVLRGILKNVK